MKPRIYLAGPMSGLPEENYPAFNAEAARLRAIGFHVENPAENPAQDSWQAYMRQAVRQMMTCDAVALLPGWENSRGALIENGLAVGLGIPVRKCAEYQGKQADPDCWLCEGTSKFADEPCAECMQVTP
jgi:nucleoside 2-deoxyribosyltransferase